VGGHLGPSPRRRLAVLRHTVFYVRGERTRASTGRCYRERGAAHAQARDRDGESIGSVFRHLFGKSQDGANHVRHLRLGSLTVPGDGAFHASWCVFEDVDAVPAESKKNNAAGMPEFGGRLGIFMEEELLNRAQGGFMRLKDRFNAIGEEAEPLGQR
jgi:hypothetical protein